MINKRLSLRRFYFYVGYLSNKWIYNEVRIVKDYNQTGESILTQSN